MQNNKYLKITIFFICIICFGSTGCDKKIKVDKPYINVRKDGYPTGNDTPEGIACDLIRAIKNNDSEEFKKVCLNQYGNSDIYHNFIRKVTTDLDKHKKNNTNNPLNPRAIGKVYAARYLSKKEPASFAYAFLNYHDIMFVDIGYLRHDGKQSINRTFVVKKEDQKWYVHPCPTITKMLSDGLNEESKSTIDFKDKYYIK